MIDALTICVVTLISAFFGYCYGFLRGRQSAGRRLDRKQQVIENLEFQLNKATQSKNSIRAQHRKLIEIVKATVPDHITAIFSTAYEKDKSE